MVLVQQAAYALGHATDELQRLIDQSRYFGDLTAHVLHLAGLRSGMRVLDIGCGAGDVSFLAASIVGPTGEVVGIDQAPEAVAAAERRARVAGLDNVRFAVADLATATFDAPFDALVGRLVLMYLPDPAVALRRLAGFVRSGGVVACQEFDLTAVRTEPPCPTVATAIRRVAEALTRAGANPRMGMALRRTFQEAGLAAPRQIMHARVEYGAEAEAYEQIVQITRTLLPVLERTGVATAAEIGIETLAARMRAEVVAGDATLLAPAFIGTWATVAA